MSHVPALIWALPFASMLLARSARTRRAIAVTTLATWLVAGLIISLAYPSPLPLGLVLAFIVMPVASAWVAGVVATNAVGGPRRYFPAIGAALLGCIAGLVIVDRAAGRSSDVSDVWWCIKGAVPPAFLGAGAAVLAAALASRRT